MTSYSGFDASADMAIARRRRRLSIDYKLSLHARLEAHHGHTPWATRAARRCFATVQRQFLSHYFWSPPRWRIWIRQFRKDRALPDFGIIGPVKSGTSDLAITIMSHPNVLHPLVKEFPSPDPLVWKQFYPTLRTVRRHARMHGTALCPFVEPCLHSLDVATTLSAICPHAKIVVNLRNPVDLVYSQWKWTVLQRERQLVERIPFLANFPAFVDKALELFPDNPSPFGFGLHNGIYVNSVAYWLRAFGEQNVHVFDISEYFKDRNTYFDRLQQFIGLPQISLPPQLPVANANPLDGLVSPPETSAKLKEFFEPYNRRLWDVIGAAYPW